MILGRRDSDEYEPWKEANKETKLKYVDRPWLVTLKEVYSGEDSQEEVIRTENTSKKAKKSWGFII